MRPQLYTVQRIGQGFLAVMARPVAQWLDDELAGLAADGVQRLVSLLEPQEAWELALQDEAPSRLRTVSSSSTTRLPIAACRATLPASVG